MVIYTKCEVTPQSLKSILLTLFLGGGGDCNNPAQTVIAPVLKNTETRNNIAAGTYKFILSPHLRENKNKTKKQKKTKQQQQQQQKKNN